jgi:NADH-quinone oxidoreductase subunit G
VFDGEGARADVDFGPTLMLNRNRCILCTRCVRFMRDIEGDAQINIIDRGHGSEIATFMETGVHSLLSGNLVDICPVGAITTRDYRFKSRPWDNAHAVDTICTQCSKGCNTTAWIKAKPEWAKGSRLVRFTPRFNPDVNGYWMCDVGRFDFHWIEGDGRLRQPLLRDAGDASGAQRPVSWAELTSKLRDRLTAAGMRNPEGVRFLVSAHASNEELFLVRRLTDDLLGEHGAKAVSIGWRFRPKSQPPDTAFRVPAIDAPNLGGAHAMGFVADGAIGAGAEAADFADLRAAVEAGRVSALYVFDPGPDGSIGDTQWIVDARKRGTLPLLMVQGVLATALAEAADFVLPGVSYVEKEASYINDQGRLQGASRVIAPPGDAMEDWQIFVNLGVALGVAFDYPTAAAVRADIARRYADRPALAGIATLAFGRPMEARHWLQASNPSERWKWDVMFQDLPPVKGAVDPSAVPFPVGAIPLRQSAGAAADDGRRSASGAGAPQAKEVE